MSPFALQVAAAVGVLVPALINDRRDSPSPPHSRRPARARRVTF